jgi:hypothetical protein
MLLARVAQLLARARHGRRRGHSVRARASADVGRAARAALRKRHCLRAIRWLERRIRFKTQLPMGLHRFRWGSRNWDISVHGSAQSGPVCSQVCSLLKFAFASCAHSRSFLVCTLLCILWTCAHRSALCAHPVHTLRFSHKFSVHRVQSLCNQVRTA